MEEFVEYCFHTLAKQKPFNWPDKLEISPVTDADIQEVETCWGYSFPEDFKAFLTSYILPDPTVVYGKFKGDWDGGGMSYSRELNRYLEWDEIPEDQEIYILKFILSGLEGMANIKECSLRENIERLSWTQTAPLGYIFIGEFTSCLVFLECMTGEVVYVDHDFYTMSHQREIDNLKEFKSTLFKSFNDLLKCLFLGAVCNGETAELEAIE